MATLEEMLMEGKDEVICYLASDEFNQREDDIILVDRELLKQYSELWNTNEPALRMLIRVIKTGSVRYLVEKAKPYETVGIRHELQAVETILTKLKKYAEEYKRLEASEGNKQVDNTSDQAPPVEEGKEGAL